jgi:hypothetical protein
LSTTVESYPVGTPVNIVCRFYSVDPISGTETLADPTAATITVIDPAGVKTTISDLTRSSTGVYFGRFATVLVGTHRCGAASTGDLVSVTDDAQFLVTGSVTA